MKARQRIAWLAAGLAALALAVVGSDFMLRAGEAGTLGMLGGFPGLIR